MIFAVRAYRNHRAAPVIGKMTRAYGRRTGRDEYKDCEIGVKYFFRFSVAREISTLPKKLVE
jgi:hypothetical protein